MICWVRTLSHVAETQCEQWMNPGNTASFVVKCIKILEVPHNMSGFLHEILLGYSRRWFNVLQNSCLNKEVGIPVPFRAFIPKNRQAGQNAQYERVRDAKYTADLTWFEHWRQSREKCAPSQRKLLIFGNEFNLTFKPSAQKVLVELRR